ncbi:MAG: hypothetical protein LBM92_09020 [Opitutaceae bacterium]|nr:hypothetical protein [Opitutaceae bacterium]
MKYSRSLASIRGWFFAGEAGLFKLHLRIKSRVFFKAFLAPFAIFCSKMIFQSLPLFFFIPHSEFRNPHSHEHPHRH